MPVLWPWNKHCRQKSHQHRKNHMLERSSMMEEKEIWICSWRINNIQYSIFATGLKKVGTTMIAVVEFMGAIKSIDIGARLLEDNMDESYKFTSQSDRRILRRQGNNTHFHKVLLRDKKEAQMFWSETYLGTQKRWKRFLCEPLNCSSKQTNYMNKGTSKFHIYTYIHT